jgi:hypothetical protein
MCLYVAKGKKLREETSKGNFRLGRVNIWDP